MLTLKSELKEINRVGQKTALLLKKLGLNTIHDLLFYFPFRYDNFAQPIAIKFLHNNQIASVQGTINLIQNKKSVRRHIYITEALISDNTASLKVIWFNQAFLTRNYKIGDKISLAGRVVENYGQLSMISPQSEKLYQGKAIHTQGLVANYHLTGKLTQKQLRFLIKSVIYLASQEKEWLPLEIRKRLKLINLGQALKQIHFPQNKKEILQARQRLAFAELFLRQLKGQLIKQSFSQKKAWALEFQEKATQNFVNSLPFKLTTAQRQAAWEILKDLTKAHPSKRLLEGDVGSGKTLVAAIAILNTVLNNKQAVIMAPTTILANQHFQTINKLFKDYNFKISLLTASHPDPIANQADIIIGTQSLIQEKIKFNNLALAVIDEQHRFGVNQRQKIIDFNTKNDIIPHFLSLSATPIPRSLALSIYGDLDLSIINQKPKGRKTVITRIIEEEKRTDTYNFVAQQIKTGHQAFVVCPVIDYSDRLGIKSAKEQYKYLNQVVFPKLKIGLLHGKLKARDKDKIMTDFSTGKYQILVSTSVIEVGVDVPQANIMIIEGAEHFGLAQLHQFRGRIGRGQDQSYCFLFVSDEIKQNKESLDRLKALVKYQNGFELAKMDLKLRGGGDIYGLDQSGWLEMKIASLFDYENIRKAQQEAKAIIKKDPYLKKYPYIKTKLGEWENDIHLE